MKSIITLCLVVMLTTVLGSCEKYDHEPILNAGYDTQVVIPSPTPSTPEEKAENDKIKEEYDKNAK